MRKIRIALLVGLVSFVNLAFALDGYVDGNELVCLSFGVNTFYYSWSEAGNVTGEVVTYTVKKRDGSGFNSADVDHSVTDDILKLDINKNHIDIFIRMKVVEGGQTQYFYLTVQVGVGDELTNGMLTATIPICGSIELVTVTVDKYHTFGVDFLWTFPTGWIQREGGMGNVVVVESDGIHLGDITCQMRITGDEFCGGEEYEDLLSPILTIPTSFRNPEIVIIEPVQASVDLDYNSTTPLTFRVSSFTGSGEIYSWTLPCGWEGPNGEMGTYVSTSATEQITPSGYSGPGEKVKVRALLDCAGTPTYTGYAEWIFEWESSQQQTVSGPSIVCHSDTEFNLSALASGTTVTWSHST